MSFQVNELSPAAAEIVGMACSEPTSPQDLARLRAVFLAHPILCIRGQTLDARGLGAFARQLGPLERQDRSAFCHPDDGDILVLSNDRRPDGTQVGIVDAGDFWHSDSSHLAEPTRVTLLHSVKNPQKGGDTHFIDMRAVYDALPDELKRRIAGRNAIHHIAKTLNPRVTISRERAGAEDYYRQREKETRPVVQPMVRTQPETGRQALYISPRFTIGIEGMDDSQAQPLLDDLFRFMFSNPAWQYTHKWRDGDLVLWDNACLNHMAGGGYEYPDTRRMHRATVVGDRPFYRAA